MASFEAITAALLAEQISAQDLVLIDTRAQADYWAGHIAGARHLDPAILSITRTDASSIARLHAVLTWTLSALGVKPESRVVVLGAKNEPNASRVAWALAYAGVRSVSLLDGGQQAWQGATTAEAPVITPVNFILTPRKDYIATAEDVLAAHERGDIVIDAREWDEYAGKKSNARRNGRIPGAQFWDTQHELDPAGAFAAPAQLAEKIASVVPSGKRAIVYCGGGGRAARTFVALHRAGHADVAVYPASWNEWGNVSDYPVETTPA